MIGAVIMFALIVFSIKEEVHAVSWNKPIAVFWFACGIFQLISAFAVSLEYLPMALIWLVLFPLLFFVWNNRKDYAVLFSEVAVAGDICFIILAVLSVACYPFNVLNYGGLLHNPNGLGQWVTFAYPLILFLYYRKTDIKWKLFYLVQICVAIVLCVASEGRTALFAVFFMSLMFIIFRVQFQPKSVRYFAKRLLGFILCLILVFFLCLLINQIVAENILHSYRIDGNFTFGQQFSQACERFFVGSAERMTGSDKTEASVNAYSSGRIGIWKQTLRMLDWKGHSSSEHIFNRRNGDIGNNVHNVLLQFAYDNGIATVLVYVLLMMFGGIRILVQALRRKKVRSIRPYLLLIHVGYVITGLLASINLPFLYVISFLYYLSYAVLFDAEYFVAK